MMPFTRGAFFMSNPSVLISVALCGVLAACNPPAQKSGSSPGTVPGPVLGPAPTIKSLELAQTHVIPPEGKTWPGEKLAKYNLHLVGGRAALALVEFDAPVRQPVLEAWANDQKLGEVALNAPNTLPGTEANGPAYRQTAHWASLEKTWIIPGLNLRVKGENTNPSEPRALKVGAPAEFTIQTLPFYLFGLTENAVPLAQTATADAASSQEYFAKHPFAGLKIVNHPAKKIVWPYIVVEPREGRAAQRVNAAEQQGDGYAVMSAVLDTLTAMRDANGDEPLNSHSYAPLLMTNGAGTYVNPGGGLGGNNVGTGDYSYGGIFIHEAGHAFGMPHANDGYTDGTYPYIGGSLQGSSWGFDQNKNRFLAPFVPTSAQTFGTCATSNFPMGRQKDAEGRCVKQDLMQSGAGDQAPDDKYTMFSDFNASLIQLYLEGTTTLKNGSRTYDGGRIFLDATSATGYSHWDTLDSKFVPVPRVTTDKGLYGLDRTLPIQRDVPVHTIIVTSSIAGSRDTNGDGTLSYADALTYDPAITQIYAPITHTGNLRRLIDPSDATQRASIVPNTGENPWYCRGSGCDYTLRVTFVDGSEQLVALQKGFRSWFGPSLDPNAANSTDSSSYRVWGVNVSAAKGIQKIELLETPEFWKGLPANPKVVATRP
jgi:Peptidase M66